MTKFLSLALVLCATVLGASQSTACEALEPPVHKVDKPISVLPDGSFSDWGEFDNYETSAAKPIVDIGGGRIGQKIRVDRGCTGEEQLLFVDCTTAEQILVHGRAAKTQIAGGWFTSIAEIQAPNGQIKLRANTTVSEIASIAKANDYGFTVDLKGYLAKMRRKNRFDPLMGCKIFYPDSKGAKG